MILIVDNYDSFVFNVARYVEELGREVRVVRNDAIMVEEAAALAPEAIVLSPGPCAPAQAGVSLPLVRALSGKIPILGICLGHQAIGEAFGGHVVRAKRPLHGRASRIAHDDGGLFQGLPQPLTVGRYHSLIVTFDDGYDGPLRITARSEEGEAMALEHAAHPTYGVQFHPESILTEHGHALLGAFLDEAKRRRTCFA